jgi:hypothetical protein
MDMSGRILLWISAAAIGKPDGSESGKRCKDAAD